jgi:hypothetical protein
VVHADLRNSKEAMEMVLPRPRSFFGCNIDIAEGHRPDRSFAFGAASAISIELALQRLVRARVSVVDRSRLNLSP